MTARSGARRVVSLVPSLTEAVASVDASALVGVTDWCTHPAGLDARRVRGTKNPDTAAIIELNPDVVLANREENREIDVARLRAAGLPVWVSTIDSLQEAFDELDAMFVDVLRWDAPAWLPEARRLWATPLPDRGTGACPIWRDPWMVVGGRTFTSDVLAHLGWRNVFAGRPRYPHVELHEIVDAAPDLVVLPDEPYPFGPADAAALGGLPTRQASGRLLMWYGPSLLEKPEL